LAVVDASARIAESFLREEHHAAMSALRALAGPLLAGGRQPTMVTDADGWVAAASAGVQISRIALPEHRDSGLAWLPAFGSCRLEPVPGGWLIPVLTDSRAETPVTKIAINLSDVHQLILSIQSQLGHWTHRLSPRHAELVLLLALNPLGISAGQLSTELYGSAQHSVAVRAEISRLRKHLVGGDVSAALPIRGLGTGPHRLPDCGADLLPASISPTIRELRGACSTVGLTLSA
jgi:hypothetical protein